MRCVVNGIDEHQCTCFMSHFGGGAHVVDRAEPVRSSTHRDDFRSTVEMTTEIIPVELARLRNHFHHANTEIPILRELHPRIDVRMMVELGNYDLIAGRELSPKRSRDVKRERSHVRAENDLVGRRIQKLSERLARECESSIRLDARWVRPFGVRVVVIQVVDDGVTHAPRHLRSSRPIEIGDSVAALPALERREMSPNLSNTHDLRWTRGSVLRHSWSGWATDVGCSHQTIRENGPHEESEHSGVGSGEITTNTSRECKMTETVADAAADREK